MTSDKIRPHHLERKAILYVRQSSAHQVLHNRGSSALQYAMRDRLAEAVLQPIGYALDWISVAEAWRDQYQPSLEEVRSRCDSEILARDERFRLA